MSEKQRLIGEGKNTDATDVMVTEEVCALLRISKRTLYRYVNNGTLKSIRPTGGRRYFHVNDINDLLRGSFNVSSKISTSSKRVA